MIDIHLQTSPLPFPPTRRQITNVIISTYLNIENHTLSPLGGSKMLLQYLFQSSRWR